MSFLQGIKSSILARFSKTAETVQVAARGIVEAAMNLSGKIYTLSYERTQIHRDMHRMDSDDEIVCFALDAIANRTLGYEDPTLDGFTVVVNNKGTKDLNETANDVIAELVERCKLRAESWQIVRKAVKFGNEFDEILIEKSKTGEWMRIGGLQTLPEHTVWPNMDKNGRRVPGYSQKPENQPTEQGIDFGDLEILHFAFGELDGYLGTPLLKAARKNWKRLNLALDFTAAARLIRAFAKWVHKVPVNASWTPEQAQKAVEEYKASMTKRPVFSSDTTSLEKEPWPSTVFTDFYIPEDGSGRGGVEMLDPENAQLQNIKDIEHMTDRLIAGTRVPKRYFPFEGSTPKLSEGGGTAEDKHFACLLMACQMMLKQGYEKLFRLELQLQGIDPATVEFQWQMAQINTTDMFRVSQTQLNQAKTMELMSKIYPELMEKLPVMLREYTSMSDSSKAALSKVEVKPREYDPNAGKSPSSRVQQPGAGAGPESRAQV